MYEDPVDNLARRAAALADHNGGDLPLIVDAAQLARYLRVSRHLVYANAERLGAIRLGDGPRARLRFVLNSETIKSWQGAGASVPPMPTSQPRCRRPISPDTQLLPIRGRNGQTNRPTD